MEPIFVGIDVAKDRLDVHIQPSGEAFSVARDDAGLADLVRRLHPLGVTLIALEATGGYEVVVPAGDGLSDWFREKNVSFTLLDGQLHVQAKDRASANSIIDALRQKNIEIESVAVKRRTLESVFIERIGCSGGL